MRRTLILTVALLLVAVVPLAQDTEDKAVEEVRGLFERQLITFGIWDDRRVLAYPALRQPFQHRQVVVDDSLRWPTRGGGSFVPLDYAVVAEDVADKPGDSVTLLWREGIHETTINTLGWLWAGCNNEGVFCRLEYTLPPMANSYRCGPFLILRRPLKYNGSIIPFTNYDLPDSSIQVISDSLSALIRKEILDRWNKPPFGVEIEFFGAISDTIPDTLFALGNGWGDHLRGVSSLSILTKAEGVWNHRLLKGPNQRRRLREIFYACDLNGDGVLEVLVKGEVSDDIYLFRDGELIFVTKQSYYPC